MQEVLGSIFFTRKWGLVSVEDRNFVFHPFSYVVNLTHKNNVDDLMFFWYQYIPSRLDLFSEKDCIIQAHQRPELVAFCKAISSPTKKKPFLAFANMHHYTCMEFIADARDSQLLTIWCGKVRATSSGLKVEQK